MERDLAQLQESECDIQDGQRSPTAGFFEELNLPQTVVGVEDDLFSDLPSMQ